MSKVLYLALAAVSGAAMALQGTWNAVLGKIVGTWESTLIVHAVGTMTVVIIMLIAGLGVGHYEKIGQVPWYAFLGGVLSVIIIYALVRSMPVIGVSNATTAIIVAQVSTAFLIDAVGAFGMKKYAFHTIDLLGIALLAIGARILLMD